MSAKNKHYNVNLKKVILVMTSIFCNLKEQLSWNWITRDFKSNIVLRVNHWSSIVLSTLQIKDMMMNCCCSSAFVSTCTAELQGLEEWPLFSRTSSRKYNRRRPKKCREICSLLLETLSRVERELSCWCFFFSQSYYEGLSSTIGFW